MVRFLSPKALKHFPPTLARADLLGLRIVRHDMAGIHVRPHNDLTHVIAEIDA
jgi:hypothetical protein